MRTFLLVGLGLLLIVTGFMGSTGKLLMATFDPQNLTGV